MKIYEMKTDGRYGIGFIDPNTINETVLNKHTEDKESSLLTFLKELNTQQEILLPYNFGSVLLCLVLQIRFCLLDVTKCSWWVMHMPAYTNVCACSFHWILLIIKIDEGKVQVLDSLLKEPKEYTSLKLMLDR